VVGLLEAASYWGALRLPLQDLLATQPMGGTLFDWLGIIQLVLEWLAAIIAGWLVGREAADRNFGLVAGLVSGIVVSVISIVYQVMAPPPLELIASVDGSADPIGGIIAATFTSLLMGVTGGWIGGWLATRTENPLM
jgi:hypothetical protein